MKKLLISLLGGRSTPNINFFLKEKPDFFIVIASKDSMQAPKGSGYILQNKVFTGLKPQEIIAVNPYSLTETAEAIERIYQQYKDKYQITIQSASEPKSMSFSAVLWAEKRKENIRFISTNFDNSVNVFAPNEPLTSHSKEVDLATYCGVYGWTKIEAQKDLAEKTQLFDFVQSNVFDFAALAKKAMVAAKNDIQYIFERSQFNQKDWAILSAAALQTEISYTDSSKQKFKLSNFLLTGDWLEYLVYLQAARIPKPNGFDAQAWNVKAWTDSGKDSSWEIDFLGISQGIATIVSCKTFSSAKSIVQSLFLELSARGAHLGQDACRLFLVVTISQKNIAADKLKSIEKWKRDHQIKVLYLEDLTNVAAFFN